MEGGEQAFVIVIKQLIDFNGNNLLRLSGWVCFLFHKMNIRTGLQDVQVLHLESSL